MANYFLTGILIGLIFGLPVGAVGALTIQRTWHFGIKAGLLTGLGSSIADCCYAIIGAFGLTLLSDFLLLHQTIIHLLGGILLLCMGVFMFLKRESPPWSTAESVGGLTLFLSSFGIGITNPATILTFLFAFSYFGIATVSTPLEGISLVWGVFMGTYLWWGAITTATYALKRKLPSHRFAHGNQVFGGILTLFGAFVLVGIFWN